MTKIQIKTLLALAARLKKTDPIVSRKLMILAEGALTRPHEVRAVQLSSKLQVALRKVLPKLSKQQFALVGGLAVHCFVPSRVTQDLDFALATSDVVALKKLFPGGRMGALVFTVAIDGVDIDFLLSDDFPFNLEAIASAKIQKSLGLPIKVVPPEYLILYKLEVAREQDITDIKNLLKLKGVYKAAQRLVKKHNSHLLENFEQLYQESHLGL